MSNYVQTNNFTQLTNAHAVVNGAAFDTEFGNIASAIATKGNNVSGSFTGTLSGMSSGTTGPINYNINGSLVTLSTLATIAGTSNAVGFTLTGLPAILIPTNVSPWAFCVLEDNSIGNTIGAAQIAAGTGVVTFAKMSAGTTSLTVNFTASGTKGLLAGWTFTYPIY